MLQKKLKQFAQSLVDDLIVDSLARTMSEAMEVNDTDVSLSLANEEVEMETKPSEGEIPKATSLQRIKSPMNDDLSQSSHGIDTDSLEENQAQNNGSPKKKWNSRSQLTVMPWKLA